jgi:hypothetical protein
MRPVDAVIWVCVAIFAATGAITLLALVNLISLGNSKEEHRYYLRRLFLLLIVQVAGAATGGFAVYIKESVHEVAVQAGGALVDVQKQLDNRLNQLEQQMQKGAVQPDTPTWILRKVGDCDGHDVDKSIGAAPQDNKCTPGRTAVCWDQQLFRNSNVAEPWCTYKDIPAASCVRGTAPGRVFECAKPK